MAPLYVGLMGPWRSPAEAARDHHCRLKQHLSLHHGANARAAYLRRKQRFGGGWERAVRVVHELEAAGGMGRASFDVRRDLRLQGGGCFKRIGAGIYIMHLLLHRAACAPPPVPSESSEPPPAHVTEFELILVRRPARCEPKTSTGGGGGGVTEILYVTRRAKNGRFFVSCRYFQTFRRLAYQFNMDFFSEPRKLLSYKKQSARSSEAVFDISAFFRPPPPLAPTSDLSELAIFKLISWTSHSPRMKQAGSRKPPVVEDHSSQHLRHFSPVTFASASCQMIMMYLSDGGGRGLVAAEVWHLPPTIEDLTLRQGPDTPILAVCMHLQPNLYNSKKHPPASGVHRPFEPGCNPRWQAEAPTLPAKIASCLPAALFTAAPDLPLARQMLTRDSWGRLNTAPAHGGGPAPPGGGSDAAQNSKLRHRRHYIPPPGTSKAPSNQHIMGPSRSICQHSGGALGGIAAGQIEVSVTQCTESQTVFKPNLNAGLIAPDNIDLMQKGMESIELPQKGRGQSTAMELETNSKRARATTHTGMNRSAGCLPDADPSKLISLFQPTAQQKKGRTSGVQLSASRQEITLHGATSHYGREDHLPLHSCIVIYSRTTWTAFRYLSGYGPSSILHPPSDCVKRIAFLAAADTRTLAQVQHARKLMDTSALSNSQRMAFLAVFFPVLDPARVPPLEDLSADAKTIEDFTCADVALQATFHLRPQGEIGLSLWPRVWPWIDFIHKRAGNLSLPDSSPQRLFYIDFTLFVGAFHSWTFLIQIENPHGCSLLLDVLSRFLAACDVHSHPERLEEIVDAAGSINTFADLVEDFIRTIVEHSRSPLDHLHRLVVFLDAADELPEERDHEWLSSPLGSLVLALFTCSNYAAELVAAVLHLCDRQEPIRKT
ncbi:hypothetical protein FB45DRAFT_875799 [Roridomyces roridus]|uniref:Uncharacterized protein n=1 Tax=Roridomyces roridus TaxID=1738132 RepID=A0AAD7B5D9_9AGAR|nr:hypothetical protein FB45DRAFT_875799 [Roridomyces roridus]